MADTCSNKDKNSIYFVTFTVHQRVDVFTSVVYRDILFESLQYCQTEKGLEIFAYVIMSSHLHLIIRSPKIDLPDMIRDFKKFTAKKIFKTIEENAKESRRVWLLLTLSYNGNIIFWKKGYQGIKIISSDMFKKKLNYIHNNPIEAQLVEHPEDYIWSSAGDYLGKRMGKLMLSKL